MAISANGVVGAVVHGLGQPRHDPLAGEPVRIAGRLDLEGDRRRQPRVVGDDHDRPAAADVDPVRPPGVQPRTGELPRGEDGVGHALVDEQPERLEVHRGLGQPDARRPPPEPPFEVAQPPADLGPPVGERRERQDRVVERLGHAVPAAIAIDEAAIGDRIAVLEPARERRTEVPGDPPVVAELRVGPVAVGGDPGVPVAIGRRGRVRRDDAGGRVQPRRLVEVAVDDEPRPAHASSARSRSTVTVFATEIDRRSPGAIDSGHESSRPLPW